MGIVARAALVWLALWGCGSGRSSDSFWRPAAACPVARFEAMGALAAGRVVVMGGFVNSSLGVTSRVDLYDPGTDSWSQSTPLPSAQTHVAVTALGDQLALAGGFIGDARSWHTTDEVWIRAVDGSFRRGPSLLSPRAAAMAATLGGTMHVVGGLAADGTSDSGEHAAGDPAGPFRQLAALPNPRNHLGGAIIGGRLYVVAGRHGWDETAGDQPELDVFDAASGAWGQGAPLPQAASEIAGATFAAGGRLIVVGGSIAGAHPTAKVWSYDPATNAWTSLPDLPEPRKGAVAVAVGREIVVTTGSPTGIDPSATTWRGCCLF